MEVLDLQLEEGRRVPMHIRRRARLPSPHTGRDLSELHGWITTTDEQIHRWLSVTLRALGERSVRALDEEGEPAGKWQLSWNSYGESVGIHTYGVILREAEDLALECLVLEQWELHPYEYREAVVGDGITIWAKAVGQPEDVERLRRMVQDGRTHAVVRRGIQNQPRRMRLHLAEWSAYEDRVKYRMVLQDEHLETASRPPLLIVEEERSRAALAYYANLVERLTELLASKGVLSSSELELAREAAHRSPTVERQEVWHVADVDAL